MSETDQQSKPAFSSNATKDNRKTNDVRGDGCKRKRRRYADAIGGGIVFVAIVVVLLLVTMMITINITASCRVL